MTHAVRMVALETTEGGRERGFLARADATYLVRQSEALVVTKKREHEEHCLLTCRHTNYTERFESA